MKNKYNEDMSNKKLIIISVIIGVLLIADGIRTAKTPQMKGSSKIEQSEKSAVLTSDTKKSEERRIADNRDFPEIKYNYAINNKRIKCINNSNIFERYKCEVTASYAWEKEIKKSLYMLKSRMSSENYDKLAENQKLWNEYEENTEKLVYAFVISKDGNYNQQIGYNFLANVKRQRNELLRTVYNFYSNMEEGGNIKEVSKYISNEAAESENTKINKYLTYLQARASKEEFQLAAKNQEIWEQLLESDKEIVHNFIQGGIVSELSVEEEVNKIYKDRAVLLRNIYNQYYKNTVVKRK